MFPLELQFIGLPHDVEKKEGLCVLCSWAVSSETLAAEIVIRQQSMSFSLVCLLQERDTLGAAQPNGKSHQSGKSCEHTALRLMTGQRIFGVFTFIGFWQFGWC
jgi:hypothetical protein